MLIGIDVGGTKTHIRVVGASGAPADVADVDVADVIVATESWQRDGQLAEAQSVRTLVELFPDSAAESRDAVLVVGAHGCDTPRQMDELAAALRAAFPGEVRVFNDAQLVGPAAGHLDAIALIAGTGAIAVGQTATGETLTAGGHGWLLADEGSAPALAREGVRAILARFDATGGTDALGENFLRATDVTNVHELARTFTGSARMQAWAVLAPLVFDAADRGSADAQGVIERGAHALARLVSGLADRDAIADAVVAAGGVVTNQPRLEDGIRRRLAEIAPGTKFSVLRDPPVAGAIEIARTLARTPVRGGK